MFDSHLCSSIDLQIRVEKKNAKIAPVKYLSVKPNRLGIAIVVVKFRLDPFKFTFDNVKLVRPEWITKR